MNTAAAELLGNGSVDVRGGNGSGGDCNGGGGRIARALTGGTTFGSVTFTAQGGTADGNVPGQSM